MRILCLAVGKAGSLGGSAQGITFFLGGVVAVSYTHLDVYNSQDQTHVQQYIPRLLEHSLNGELKPEVKITHRLPLEEAERGYAIFDRKEESCRKVVLMPGATADSTTHISGSD